MHAQQRFYLHVGAAKTGTSYIQNVLRASGEGLREHGVELVPREAAAHFNLAVHISGGAAETDTEALKQVRSRFAAQLAEHETPIGLFTHEVMGLASVEAARELLAMLDGYEVHVIVTMRDLGRLLPSSWQQAVKQRQLTPFVEYLRAVVDDTELGRQILYDRGLLELLGRWTQVVPAERVHVVVGPPPGAPPQLLAERFCSVLGVGPGALTYPDGVVNPSLGLVQAELLRRVNVALGDRLPTPRQGYREVGKRWLGREVLLRQTGERPALPAFMRAWVDDVTASWLDYLRTSGVDVVGDPAELISAPSAFTPDERPVEPDELVDAAVTALADILELRHEDRLQDLRARRRRNRRRRAAARARRVAASPPRRVRRAARAVWRRTRRVSER